MEELKELKLRIRSLSKERKVKMIKVAEALNIDYLHAAKVLGPNSSRRIAATWIPVIARAIGVTPNDIYGFTATGEQNEQAECSA